jgi:hypothetical protein
MHVGYGARMDEDQQNMQNALAEWQLTGKARNAGRQPPVLKSSAKAIEIGNIRFFGGLYQAPSKPIPNTEPESSALQLKAGVRIRFDSPLGRP